MASHIALLRAVNVGGRSLKMGDLVAFARDLGLDNPRTLLQSGNLVFEGADSSDAGLEKRFEAEAEARFGFQTDFIVRSAAEWRALIEANPFADEARNDPSHLLVMPLKAAPAKDALKALRAAIKGPERAGKDILLGSIWPDYKRPKHPVDFVLEKEGELLAIGFARYDGDRGGAQEDDRTGGYLGASAEVLAYAVTEKLRKVKLIFLNDGPGLLLGSMWTDYAALEEVGNGRIMVCTLRMVPERITLEWLES